VKFETIYGAERSLRNPYKYSIDWGVESVSLLQTEVKTFLFPYWKNDVVFEEMPLVGTKLTFDFYNASEKIAVEVQGQQHVKFVKYFHGNKQNFLHQLKRDSIKEDFSHANDIKLMTIFYDDILSEELFKEYGIILCK
jgi:hypothetical protein